MAITIHQQPATHSAIGSKLIIVASSTNVGNDGFMYVVEVTQPVGTSIFFVPQNPSGYLVFDPTESMKPFMRNCPNEEGYDPTRSIHAFADSQIGTTEIQTDGSGLAGFNMFAIIIKEAWIIGGELVVDDDSVESVHFYVYNAHLSLHYGLNYDYLDSIGYNEGVNSYIMSDRLHSTHNWVEAASVGLIANDPVYIPAYESDYGVCSILSSVVGVDAPKIKVSILPSSGSPIQQILDLPLGGSYNNCGLYPANLNASTIVGIPKPQDYPNWKAIYFQVLDAAEDTISKTYVMYNAEKYGQCLGVYEKVSLAWVGRRGGWERQNFILESQKEIVTEKKIAQRPIGNYGQVGGGTPFAFNSFDESEVVTDMKVDLFLNATSGWLTDGEFEFLKGLFMSKQVHWLHDDGTHTPVIVQSDGYKIQRNFNATKKYDLKIRVKIAQEQFN